MTQIMNFGAGPASLPAPVLEQVQRELLNYKGGGLSILEMSHFSSEYQAIDADAKNRLRKLLGADRGYRVLFMQGGASTQFALVPLNFCADGSLADYVLTGFWSERAYNEALRAGQAHIAASTRDEQYRRIPGADEICLSDPSAYVHITSNDTAHGTQWHTWPDVGKRSLVADMSSDLLTRPLDIRRFGLIYASAQKNLGPAGVTVVLVREDWLEQVPKTLPAALSYASYAKEDWFFNTPPVFAVYMLNLVLQWVETCGGLAAIGLRNKQKAEVLYQAVDLSEGFYHGAVALDSRSQTNVVFHLASEALEQQFVAEAAVAGIVGLKGFFPVGGIRVSLYNPIGLENCVALASFMTDFARKHG